MPQPIINRDEIVNKLTIINKIIRKGYEYVYTNTTAKNREYCLSIKNHDYFQLREQLVSELYPLICK